ncbi:MAG: NADPH-dependent oxidoreductase [Microbacteriaceae bacterium]|nr:NADPH-dependent oxidoreductase [Microbacteriaceae bacterium]
MLTVTVLAGNPKPQSRTLSIATALVEALLESGSYELTVIDLAEHTAELFAWPSDIMSALSAKVTSSDLVVVASPTYKATYTGLLKSFLDRFPSGGLGGITAIPVMTGGDLTHAMGPDTHLRPLLVELGASVPTKSLYFVAAEMDQVKEIVNAWVADARETLIRQMPLLQVAASTPAAAV